MTISLGVPFLPKVDIASKANAFLEEHNLTSIPINIELITERDFEIHIVPFSSLKREYGIDGYSAHDGSIIYVDGYAYHETPNRLRFTVAHELGHLILHRPYFQQVNWSSVEEWIEILGQLDTKDIDWMEYQALAFAGLVLVPQSNLKTCFDEQLQSLQSQIQRARSSGVSRADYIETVIYAIADRLSRKFEVSIGVIGKRIDFDSLSQIIK